MKISVPHFPVHHQPTKISPTHGFDHLHHSSLCQLEEYSYRFGSKFRNTNYFWSKLYFFIKNYVWNGICQKLSSSKYRDFVQIFKDFKTQFSKIFLKIHVNPKYKISLVRLFLTPYVTFELLFVFDPFDEVLTFRRF